MRTLSLALAAGTTFAQTVVLTSNTTLNPGATTIGGVPLATADVVVQGATLTVNGAHTIRSLEVRRSGTTVPGVVTHGEAVHAWPVIQVPSPQSSAVVTTQLRTEQQAP